MKRILIIVCIGLLLGIATSFGQTYLPVPVKQFANSYSVWLLFSYLYGRYARSGRKFVLTAGAMIQILALIGYYSISELRFGLGIGSISIFLTWLIGGVVAGPILALLGHWSKNNRISRLTAVAVMTLVISSEALYLAIVLRYMSQSLCFVTLAVVFILLNVLDYRYRLKD